MKQVILICILCCSIPAISQDGGDPHSKKPVDYYLDSVQIINMEHFIFDVNEIGNLSIVKTDSLSKFAGKIYIQSKQPKGFSWIPLSELKEQYAKTSRLTIYMINNEIIRNNAREYRIDSSFIAKVEVVKASDIETVKKQVPALTIMNIVTKTKENFGKAIKPSGIMIRGTETSRL